MPEDDLPAAHVPVAELGRRAKAASVQLRTATTPQKDDALVMAAELLASRADELLEANVDRRAAGHRGGCDADRARPAAS